MSQVALVDCIAERKIAHLTKNDTISNFNAELK